AAMNEVMRDQGRRQHEIKILSPGERHFILTAVSTEIGQQIARDNEGTINAVAIALHEVTALKRSEQMRADFVANASHELRTPLASLIGFIETLQDHAQEDPEARARFLAIMSQESSRMARLIDDLLSLSRIELDEHVSPSNVVNAGAIIRGVTQTLQMKADDAKVKIELGLEIADIKVIADSDQLTQIFQNLIDNAIKYGRQGGVVRITSRSVSRLPETAGPAIAFEIFNEGEGIAREHLPRLTDRFYRVDAARSRELGGTGLGLAIVKHIVNRHRGRLVFESELGVGTKVTVTLLTPDSRSLPKAPR
ncbi:MAG: ATP-binding protein, partial [Proteobacteria bacterium]|nr:ATP-binding protein [Pseudomonadota bacterium]